MALEKNFDAVTAEARIYNAWESKGCFKAGANASRKDTFCIMIPPPNVTGALHVGHAFNNTLQDLLTRWHRMRGFDTLWQPGQDHAGIATQLQVEKMLLQEGKQSRREMGREKFLEKVWEWKGKYGDTIINQLKRLGASCDWSRNAFTMAGAPGDPQTGHENSPNFHDAVLKVFIEFFDKGLIYRGKRLVNWDPHFETAISDLEVENIETDGHMWHFKYLLAGGETYTYIEKDKNGKIIKKENRDYISIATTRPETMLGDGAVAVHPEDQRYTPVIGKMCEIPLGPKSARRLIPIILDDYPDPDFGSGAVKITGAHDSNDYQVAKRAKIPMYRLMDTRGIMRSDGSNYNLEVEKTKAFSKGADFDDNEIDLINLVPEEYRGLDRFEARKLVISNTESEGLLIKTEQKKIMQPFGDRSGVVIEPMLTDQWFVDTKKLVQKAIEAVQEGKTKIVPDSGKKVYFHWLKNIEPWCISRQLWWGHQIPVWFDKNKNMYCAADKAAAQKIAEPKVELTQDPDVLDTWFSSGLWPMGTLGWPQKTDELQKYHPTNTLVTGQDILFFWVARMMMMQLSVLDQVPFKEVYLHQLVRDEHGQKMSKTKGNVIDPIEIIDEFGADALRFANVSMAALGGVLKLSVQRIRGYRNFGTKLWNAARFAEINEAYLTPKLDPTRNETFEIRQNLNKWIVGETAKTRLLVDQAFSTYRFNDAANTLYSFVWRTVCDWYVEFSKPLLSGEDEEKRLETQMTMAWVIDQCLILLHPIMPFITEELWGSLSHREKMLIHADWPDYGFEIIDEKADSEINWVIGIIEEIRSVRMQMHVPAGAKIPLLMISIDVDKQNAWEENCFLIKRLARIEQIDVCVNFPRGCATLAVPGANLGLPLADIINFEEEKSRLEKSLEKNSKELKNLKNRIKNTKFLESAPKEVVEDVRKNLALKQEQEDQINAALSRLEELS